MKVDRHGRAKVLTQAEIRLLFNQGLATSRDRALFGVCLFTACRINEACSLQVTDIYDTATRIRPYLIIRKGNSKRKLATRTIPVIADLRALLSSYSPVQGQKYMFPGRYEGSHINPDSAARILRKACHLVGLEGVSTHSFRRTAGASNGWGTISRISENRRGHKKGAPSRYT